MTSRPSCSLTSLLLLSTLVLAAPACGQDAPTIPAEGAPKASVEDAPSGGEPSGADRVGTDPPVAEAPPPAGVPGWTPTPNPETPVDPGPGPQTPPPLPAPSNVGPSTTPETPLPLPAGALVYHFADCQAGAAPGCVPGDDTNPGTELAPKRDFRSVPFNTLPAGSQLRFKRGGAWSVPVTRLENMNATPAAPLVFDAYGTGPAPVLRPQGFVTIEFGGLNNQTNDGGYYFRSLKLDGNGASDWGFWLRDNLRNVTFERVEITGFKIAIHIQQSAPHYITGTRIRQAYIHRNSSMGLLGNMNGGTIEGSLFERNNFSGSGFEHAIYLSGGAGNTLRNNRFVRNSVVNGVCTGGNVTIHGQNTGLLIEGNTIEQDQATGGCYGFSITPGYASVEWFRQTVVRGNTVVNVGYCSVCAGAAPGIVVENNLAINTMPNFYHVGVNIPTSVTAGSGDDIDSGAVVRDNVSCQPQPGNGSDTVKVSGAGAVVTNNVFRTGAQASTGPCQR